MVRINIINPAHLSDQHLIAEYNEILILLAYFKKYPSLNDIPREYVLGKGHMKFFRDKLVYIKKRHDLIKSEMKRRGFKARKDFDIKKFDIKYHGDWKPIERDFGIIKERLISKIKLKPNYYRHYGIYQPQGFFIKKIKTA